jgi:phosphatidylglycerophosphate synthase
MARVHLAPWWWVLGGAAALFLTDLTSKLSPLGWAAGSLWLVGSTTLLTVGLARRGMPHLGPANAATATRSRLVAVVTALAATSFTRPASVALLVAVTVPALALDAVDGWLARRTGSASELGARFDMEVDAFLLLVLSAFVAPTVGGWSLAIGVMRYAFVAIGWVLPWMNATLPFRYWRKVVTASCGIALTLAASGLLPPVADTVVVGVALALLVESFGRDVVWLVRRRVAGRGRQAEAGTASTSREAPPTVSGWTPRR